MSTRNPRINVTFEETMVTALHMLAHQEHKSVAGVVRELAMEALEMREDIYFSNLAEKLDKPGVKTFSHEEAWQLS